MSGPVSTTDAAPVADTGHPQPPCVEVGDDRTATVGRFEVRRALPRRGRRTVGAWCFADHMGPAQVSAESGLDIGPHPHIGLQTVTWLVTGEALHRDSLGSEQVIKPGELNLMTAGGGIAHAEEATGAYSGELHGVQLWVALPEHTRHGPSAFDHVTDLPRVDVGRAEAAVLVGEFAGATSPARHDTPLVGVDIALHGPADAPADVPLRRDFEYALIVLTGQASLHDTVLRPGQLGYLGAGREAVDLRADEPTRLLLLGGEPFDEPILMWWNFVARDRAEIEQAYDDWRGAADRFGTVASALPHIPAPAPIWRPGGRSPERSSAH
jgi:redox-sensitive bicupin YhaK (pirin superfamily)